MQVNMPPADIAGSEAVQRGAQSAPVAPASVDPTSSVRRVDDVEISDAGRALSGNEASSDIETAVELDPRRTDELRSKILSGAFNSLEMADQVARAMIRSGDI
jgi:negative regulator of flagellin synthesis FlgM